MPIDIQEEIVPAVTWAVAKIAVVRPLPSSDMSNVNALRLFMEARRINARPSREGIVSTIDLAQTAVEMAPDAVWGYLGAGWARRHLAVHYADEPEKSKLLAEAVEYAERAISIDPDNYLGHYLRARLHQELGESDQAIAEYEIAISLNPSAPNVLVGSSSPLLYAGRIDEAIDIIERALSIDPKHRGWFHWQMAWALWEKERCDDGLSALERMATIPNAAHRMLAAIYACLERRADAAKALRVYLEEKPDATLSAERLKLEKTWQNQQSLDRWMKDMAYAGMPE